MYDTAKDVQSFLVKHVTFWKGAFQLRKFYWLIWGTTFRKLLSRVMDFCKRWSF